MKAGAPSRFRGAPNAADPEATRLSDDAARARNWKRWGTYLSERQWGTVREDYSADGDSWAYFTHDDARSRAYRWGEDGLLGFCDREARLCFATALWNEQDPFLKERLFGLSNPQGNHGEDVKELYYYLDATPTHSYCKALYKYPQAAFPYEALISENARRGREAPEYELLDTGAFDGDRYFDVFVEYAKAAPDDILIRITAHNRGPDPAPLHLLPTLWFRNTWSWGRAGQEGYWAKPRLSLRDGRLEAEHETLGRSVLEARDAPEWLFTENESDLEALFPDAHNAGPFVKNAFHRRVVQGERAAVRPEPEGTKAAAHYRFVVPASQSVTLALRLRTEADAANSPDAFADFAEIFTARIAEADAFYATRLPGPSDGAAESAKAAAESASTVNEARLVARQAFAGLLWSKQYYGYVVRDWLDGDPPYPSPPRERHAGRNAEWRHLYARDVLSMPDKWEYPWFASWDLAFHTLPLARVDPDFAKEQLVLLGREWYMRPNGQLPAYEYDFSNVNPPVHAWAAWRVYKRSGPRGARDRHFLERIFAKALLNFTWWVNRKDRDGNNLFSGGFLGLDNVGVFDRSQPLPDGGTLEQADGTAWMAFYCTTLLAMALELARDNPAYEDIASKFFEHFVAIADAMNALGGGLWDEADGFYYSQLHHQGACGRRGVPLRLRSLVGLIPLYACEVLDDAALDPLPGFRRRMRWLLQNRPDLAATLSYASTAGACRQGQRLLAIPSRERLVRVLRYALDEREFLSDHGLRSLSRVHAEHPYVFEVAGQQHSVRYAPAESDSAMFGGNSNWRGPIWFPLNYLFIEALERYHHFYGEGLRVECPTGSGHLLTLAEVARELARRLARLFLPDEHGARPCHGDEARYARDPHWSRLVLFHEYFHGESGKGLGASHQTGWTALAVEALADALRG